MENVAETAVSLDELTLDITFDTPNDFSNKYETDVLQNDDDNTELIIPNSGTVERNGGEESNHDTGGESILTGRDINVEMRLKNPDFISEFHSDHQQNQTSYISKTGNENDVSDDDFDFEDDVPPLSLFPSKRDDDDGDDFDFDFPDPNVSQPNTNTSNDNISSLQEIQKPADVPPLSLFPKNQDNNDDDFDFDFPDSSIRIKNNDIPGIDNASFVQQDRTVQFSEQNQELQRSPTQKPSSVSNMFEPELLTPRDKTTSELSSMSILQKIAQNEYNINLHSKSPDENKSPNILGMSESEDKEMDRPKPSIVSTTEDWDNVQVVIPGFVEEGKSLKDVPPNIESKPLAKFSESWSELSSLNYDSVKDQIKTKTDRRGFSALTHLLFGPPKIQKDLVADRDLIFCLAATKFDNDNVLHNRILQTIYRCLTGSKFDCQRYGAHWEEIGFQGQDPSTDLRGAGVLSLLHILYFLQDPITKELARDIYKLSLHPTQNFPFCVMSINITVMCLRVVREDVYNREFNKRKDIVGPFNSLFAALYLRLYQLWKKGKTIHDSGYLLEDVSNYSRKNAKTIFKDLETYEKNRKDPNLFGDQSPDSAAFLNVCREEKCDGKTAAELY